MNSAAFIAAQPIMIQRAKLISNATITALLPFYVSLSQTQLFSPNYARQRRIPAEIFDNLTDAGVWVRNARVARKRRDDT